MPWRPTHELLRVQLRTRSSPRIPCLLTCMSWRFIKPRDVDSVLFPVFVSVPADGGFQLIHLCFVPYPVVLGLRVGANRLGICQQINQHGRRVNLHVPAEQTLFLYL